MSAVYRVETLDGAGPYRDDVLSHLDRLRSEARGPEPEPPDVEYGTEGYQGAWDAHQREWLEWYHKEPPLTDLWRHPLPDMGWGAHVRARRPWRYGDNADWAIFGCPTVASLCAWFRGWGVHLSTLGFVVREYNTEVLWSKVHREANGLAQCVFDRRSARIVATHDPANFIY